jgi:two-component system sensor histidine kinase UhpB
MAEQPPRARRQAARAPTAALFWRQFLATGLVFVIFTAVLVLTPATVSTPIVLRELAVLGVGLTLLLAVNAFLLRATLRPLDGLTALMQRVDLLRPGQRAQADGLGDVANLIRSFNQMLDRLEAERGASAAQALAAQEGERQRIARQLHDEISQSLTAVLLELKRAVDRAPADLRENLHPGSAVRGQVWRLNLGLSWEDGRVETGRACVHARPEAG